MKQLFAEFPNTALFGAAASYAWENGTVLLSTFDKYYTVINYMQFAVTRN